MNIFRLLSTSQLNKKYIYNFFSVAGGTLIAQLITFIASPAISRLYEPSAFGYFATYSATISILAVISCARYELAIPLPKDIEESINIFKTAFFVSIIITIIVFPIILFLYFTNDTSSRLALVLYPIVILLNCLGLCLNLLHNKISNFGHSSFSKVLQAVLVIIISLSISNIFKSHGLIISSFAGQILNIIYLIYFLPKNLKVFLFKYSFDRKLFSEVIYKYKQFPTVSLLPAFLNIFSSQMPNYLISNIHGAIFVGYYFFSLRLVVLPVSLIGSSINEIFYQKVIEKKNNGEPLQIFLRNNFIFLFSMGLIFLLFFYFLSDSLIPLFFGSLWTPSVIVCKILSISMFVKLVVSPLTMSFIALDKVRVSAIWQYAYFAGILLLSVIIFIAKIEFIKSLQLLVAFDFIAYSVALFFIYYCVKSYDKSIA